MFVLVYMLIYIGLAILTAVLPGVLATVFGGLTMIFALGLLIPTLAVATRRLHDSDRSGWWQLVSLIPFGFFYVLYLLIIEGTPGDNRFGPPAVAAIPNAV